MKVDRDIESCRPEAAHQACLRHESGPAGYDDDFIEVRIGGDDGRGGRFDEIGDVRVREVPAESPHCRSGEDYVPDFAQPNQEQLFQLPNYQITQ